MTLALLIAGTVIALGCVGAWAGNRVAKALREAPSTDDLEDEPAPERQASYAKEPEPDGVLWQRGNDYELRLDGKHYRKGRDSTGALAFYTYPGGHEVEAGLWLRLHELIKNHEKDQEAEARRAKWAAEKPPEPAKPPEPFGLKWWRHVGGICDRRRIQLNNGLTFEGFGRVNWLVYPSGERAADYACEILAKLNQQIDWNLHADKKQLNDIELHDKRVAESRARADDEPILSVATAIDRHRLNQAHIERERRLQADRDRRQADIEAQMGAGPGLYNQAQLANGYTSGTLLIDDDGVGFQRQVYWNSPEELAELLKDPDVRKAWDR